MLTRISSRPGGSGIGRSSSRALASHSPITIYSIGDLLVITGAIPYNHLNDKRGKRQHGLNSLPLNRLTGKRVPSFGTNLAEVCVCLPRSECCWGACWCWSRRRHGREPRRCRGTCRRSYSGYRHCAMMPPDVCQ